MEKFPILYNRCTIGELSACEMGEDTVFSARCRLPEKGLWCLWIVGREGTLRLGLPPQQSGEAALSRRFSRRMTAPVGRVTHGELRPAMQERKGGWEQAPRPELLFHTPWLRRALQGKGGALTRREGKCRLLALPYDCERPFPLTSLFCFARVRSLGTGSYAVFAFDEKEWPVVPPDSL